jgi:hypothetical protein
MKQLPGGGDPQRRKYQRLEPRLLIRRLLPEVDVRAVLEEGEEVFRQWFRRLVATL